MERLKVGFLVNDPNNIDQCTNEILDNLNKKNHLFYKPIIIYGYTRNRYSSKSLLKKIKGINNYMKLKYIIRKIFYINLSKI